MPYALPSQAPISSYYGNDFKQKFIEYFINNQGVKKKITIKIVLSLEFRVCARRGDFCVVKSGKDQQEEASKLFIALPEMLFYDSSVLCFDLSFANSIHFQNNKKN